MTTLALWRTKSRIPHVQIHSHHLYTIQLITTGTSPQPSFQLVTSKNSWSPAHTLHEGGFVHNYALIFTKDLFLDSCIGIPITSQSYHDSCKYFKIPDFPQYI